MKKLWIVVYVHRGMIQDPELFFDAESALTRETEIRQTMNRDYMNLRCLKRI